MPCRRGSSPLAQIMIDKGLGVAALAADAGLSINAARRIVNGQQQPSIVTALLIARSVDEEVEALFSQRGRRTRGRK